MILVGWPFWSWQDVLDLVNWKEKDSTRYKGSMEIIPSSSSPKWLKPGCKNLCHVEPIILSFYMLIKTDISWCVKVKSSWDEILSTSLSLGDAIFEGCSSVQQSSLTSVEIRELDITDESIKILPLSGSGQCFINFEELFLGDFFKNFRNECGQQRSLEQLRISIIRQLDTWNSRYTHDAFRSIEELLFCKSCELSQTRSLTYPSAPSRRALSSKSYLIHNIRFLHLTECSLREWRK